MPLRSLLPLGAALAALGFWCGRVAAEENVPGFWRQLGQGATYVLESYASYFPQNYHSTPVRIVDDRDAVFWTRAAARSQVFLKDSLVFKAAGFAAYSTHDSEIRGAFAFPDTEKPHARYVDLKELSLRWDLQRFALTVGRAPIPVGLSTLYSPADRYRVINAANPMKLDDLGAWQASVDFFLGENTLRLSALPVEERSTAPFGRSRWLGDVPVDFVQTASTTTAGMGGGVTGLEIPAGGTARVVFRNRPGFLAKYSGVVPGADYFAALHYGPSVYPVLQNPSALNFIVETPEALTSSAGAAKTMGAWEVHAEGAYQVTQSGQDEDFLRYVLGFTYRETRAAGAMGLDEIVPTVEYAGEHVTDEQDSQGYVVGSFKARPFTSSLLFKIDLIFSDKLTGIIGGIRNFVGDDYAHAFGLEYRPNDDLTWKAGVVFFGGRLGTPFGFWDRNDHLEVGVVRRF